MPDPIYEKLIPALNSRGTILPSIKCDEFFALVEYLFTPEEAAIFSAMPHGFSTVDKIAEKLGAKDTQKLSLQLETMCDKGLIHMKQEKGNKLYEALPFLPGITELQFIKGVVDERHKKITSLLDNYNRAVRNMLKAGTPLQTAESAPGRKVAVDQEIFQRITVIPYKEMKELINETDFISAGICNCRLQGALRDKPCSKPDNNCMVFGTSARSTVERGFTKKLTREEALQMLEDAEKAGLVHQYCNTPDRYTNLLCNCCICHCGLLKGSSKSPVPSLSVIARYLIQINDSDCVGCEACIDRCQLAALKMVDGKLTRDEKRCIGCGICMYVCPTDALSLEPREAGKVPLKK